MEEIFAALDRVGAYFLFVGCGLLVLAVPVWLTAKLFPEIKKPLKGGTYWEPTAWEKRRHVLKQIGFAALMFVVMAITFGPSLDALKRHGCKGAKDFQLCIEGE